jgi:three-Cys-motif partner protein
MVLPELADDETRRFADGSARVALETEPCFHRYIFIEKSARRCAELDRLKQRFPDLADRVSVRQGDANNELLEMCDKSWSRHRAVVFLDPYGMQIRWTTVQALTRTNGVDLWYLFPLGVAVNRLLKRHGSIDEVSRRGLNDLFGTSEWYEAFYRTATADDLFGKHEVTSKAAGFKTISEFFVDRLSSEFARVAKNPLPLFNSKNIPLYLLCFASANPRGSQIGVKIAQHILGSV